MQISLAYIPNATTNKYNLRDIDRNAKVNLEI